MVVRCLLAICGAAPAQSRKGALDRYLNALHLPAERTAPLTKEQKYVQERLWAHSSTLNA